MKISTPSDRGSLQLPVAAGLVERLEVQISNTPQLTGHFHLPRPGLLPASPQWVQAIESIAAVCARWRTPA
jgi:hypothetical protein